MALSSREISLRLLLVWAIGTILAILAGGVFDQFRWELFLAPTLAVVAVSSTRSQNRIIRTIAALASVVTGVVVTVWVAAGSFDQIGSGLAEGPRRLLTTEWPSPTEPTLVGTIALLLAGASAVAAVLALDERWHLLPLVPLLACLMCLLALSAPLRPQAWQLVIAGAAALAFSLTRPSSRHRRSLLADRTVAITVIGLLVVAIASSSALAWADRADPRSTDPAHLSAVLLDPIEAIVALRQADPPIELVHITDRSATAAAVLPDRWRIAALDDYDGQRWVPRLTLRPIGGTLTTHDELRPGASPPISYQLEYTTDDVDAILLPGRPISVDADVETDEDRVVVRLPQRPTPGDTVQVVAEPAPGAGDARIAGFVSRQVDETAATFTAQATTLAGDGTALERLRRIEQAMHTDWQLDPSAPGGGQQLALLERFATETRRGTSEQFVTTFVVFARSLGFDARVATGFVVPTDQLGATLTIDSTQATAWAEVQLDGLGWLAFDPVPAVTASEIDEPPPPPDAQSPAAAQPPIAEPAEPADDLDDLVDEDQAGGERWRSVRTWLLRVGAVGGLGLLPLITAAGAVLFVKWRRRRRRLQADDPLAVVRGVWANTTDALVDAGLTIAPAWTDGRIASHAASLAPGAPHEVRRLAAMATAVTFGSAPAAITGDAGRLADDAVQTSDTVVDAIRTPLSRWQRVRWWLSVRSLRRSTRSPVEV